MRAFPASAAAEGDRATPMLLTVAFPVSQRTRGDLTGMLLLTLDFEEYVRAYGRHQPRHLTYLTDQDGRVLIHPESIIHSFVEFTDGSVLAQLSPPDMRLPIQYALTYPERVAGPARRLKWEELSRWQFEQPDLETFPAVQLGYDVARAGGSAGAVLNAANEAAVGRFLAGELRFLDIPRVCRAVLANHHYSARPTLAELGRLDRWARQEVARWTASPHPSARTT